jgi:hypothetical protein
MNYGMDCFCNTAVRRNMRGLFSEERSEINLEKMWLLVELFDNSDGDGSEGDFERER